MREFMDLSSFVANWSPVVEDLRTTETLKSHTCIAALIQRHVQHICKQLLLSLTNPSVVT